MKRNLLNFGKMVAMGVTIAVSTMSCNRDSDTPNGSGNGGQTATNTTFNIIHRVAGTSAISDWSFQPLKEAEMKSGEITFQNKGYNLAQDRTHQLFSTNNGNTIYVYSSMTRLITKYETNGTTSFYNKVGEIDATPIVGNTFANFKVIDDKNALIYIATPAHQTTNGVYSKTVVSLKIGRINLENFSADLKDVKTITLPELPSTTDLPNAYIAGIEHPVLVSGKLYFGTRKVGYDPTKTGRAVTIQNENGYYSSTLVLDFPSFNNATLLTSTIGKGASTYPSVFYAPSYAKTNADVIYHANPMKGNIYKISGGVYDNSYELSLKTALGESSDVWISGMFYTENNIAYVMYAPAASVLQGGLIYQQGKAVWKIARVDLNAKTAIKMNVAENLWLTFYQSAKYVDGKLYMALCPMTGDGNVYIFDPKKADANGFEKGATLKSAGGAIYLGVF